jgi:hypothetical protein
MKTSLLTMLIELQVYGQIELRIKKIKHFFEPVCTFTMLLYACYNVMLDNNEIANKCSDSVYQTGSSACGLNVCRNERVVVYR